MLILLILAINIAAYNNGPACQGRLSRQNGKRKLPLTGRMIEVIPEPMGDIETVKAKDSAERNNNRIPERGSAVKIKSVISASSTETTRH